MGNQYSSETRAPIDTNHQLAVPDELAATIPEDDPLRGRLQDDEEFARLFLMEELGYLPTTDDA